MRVAVVILGICVLAGAAIAEKPVQEPVQVTEVECAFQYIASEINLGQSDGGLTAPNTCDPTGGGAAWQWGMDPTIPPPPPPYGPNVWGTILGGNYGNNSGDGLLSPEFVVTVGQNELVELVHYVDMETNYDGGNAVVIHGAGETILEPLGGYPATISTSASYYAYCVDLEPGFTGHVNAWTADCADLTPWDGQTIQIRIDFGSDSSVSYPGWYLAAIRFGTDEPVAVENSTWGQIKKTYR